MPQAGSLILGLLSGKVPKATVKAPEPPPVQAGPVAPRPTPAGVAKDVLVQRTAMLRLGARWELAMRDPHLFMKWFVFTNKPSGEGRVRRNKVVAFPDRPHLEILTDLWQDNPLMLVSKCRQMIVTWWCSAIALWCGLSKKGSLIMLQSKKLEDVVGDELTGDGLMGRAKFIYNHIPAKGYLGVECDKQMATMKFPKSGSTLWAIPQGADQIRQRTPSGIITDECAFQAEFEQAFTASMPCLRSGGWLLAVTTASCEDGGFTKRLVQDVPDIN